MATTLKIDGPDPGVLSLRAGEIVSAVCAFGEADLGGLSAYLNSVELDSEEDSIEDLRQWLPALERFDVLLAQLSQRVVTSFPGAVGAVLEGDGLGVKEALCSILNFLRGLLKRGKEKRCFLSYVHCPW